MFEEIWNGILKGCTLVWHMEVL